MTDIREEDIEVVSGCAAVHPMNRGGQHVAMECAGVLVIHKPTGIGVRVSDERSQFKCKQAALARLAELLSVDIVERVQSETIESIASWLASRDAGPDPRSRGALADDIRLGLWRKEQP